MPRRSSKRRGFGVCLGTIRDSLGEGQIAFADRVNLSRSLVGMLETGARHPTEHILAHLVRMFPEHETELRQAAKQHQPPGVLRVPPSSLAHFTKSQIAAGEITGARNALIQALKVACDDRDRLGILRELAFVYLLLDAQDAHQLTLREAIALGKRLGMHGRDLAKLWKQLATSLSLQGLDDRATEAIEEGLLYCPTSVDLWLCKGVMQWSAHELSSAQATLTMALRHAKGQRHEVLYVRGQVFAESHQHMDANSDLTAVLGENRMSDCQRAQAYAARGYARFKQLELVQAFSDFDRAEHLAPNSGVLHYFRGLCYADLDMPQLARIDFEVALHAKNSRLLLPQVEKVKHCLLELTVSAELKRLEREARSCAMV